MTKTANEVADRALELLGLKPIGQEADAADASIATETYTALLSELSDIEGMAFEWSAAETPEWAFMPLAGMIASRIAPIYQKQFDGIGPRKRLYALVFQDDRTPGVAQAVRYY